MIRWRCGSCRRRRWPWQGSCQACQEAAYERSLHQAFMRRADEVIARARQAHVELPLEYPREAKR